MPLLLGLKGVCHEMHTTEKTVCSIISAKSKSNSKILHPVFQGPSWVQIMKQNGGRKSRDTLPLRVDREHFLSFLAGYDWYSLLWFHRLTFIWQGKGQNNAFGLFILVKIVQKWKTFVRQEPKEKVFTYSKDLNEQYQISTSSFFIVQFHSNSKGGIRTQDHQKSKTACNLWATYFNMYSMIDKYFIINNRNIYNFFSLLCQNKLFWTVHFSLGN